MKISVDPKVLAEAVGWASRYIPQRPSVPVMTGLLLNADGETLTLSAFDYDVSAVTVVAADVAEPGRVLLPGRVLAEVCKALPGESFATLALGEGEGEVSLTCGRAAFNLRTLPVGDFPALPEPPAPFGTVDGDVFATAVAQVAEAVTHDPTLPMLTGIRLDAAADLLTLAATDRYRIHVRDLPWSPTAVDIPGVLISGGVLSEAAKTLRGVVTLGWDTDRVSISAGGRTVVARLLDPQFIDYRSRVASGGPVTATVDTGLFIAAVKRVALLAEKHAAVRCRFSPDEVYVTASTDDLGKGAETVPCVLDAEDFQIAFQPKYLLDALAGVQTPEVVFQMEGSTKPALLLGKGDDSYRALTMSLRIA